VFALNGIVFQEVTDQMNRKVEGYQIYGIIGFVLVSAIYWGVVWCICAVSGPILWINKITTVSDEEKRETKRSQDLENMDPELKELLQKLKQI
jgi:hypothetical protein